MNIALVCLIGTLLAYLCSRIIYKRLPYLIFSPAILVSTVIIGLLVYFHVSYDVYMQENQWIVWMIGPATVAFAVPIYEYRKIIQQNTLAISLGIMVGMVVGMLTAFFLAKIFHFDHETTLSLMARSISTPFALELTEHVGGSVQLVILFTIITGIVGMILGDSVLAGLKLKSYLAHGASLGNSAHAFGTSKAYMRDQQEGVVASLTMVIAGIFMVIAGPFLIHLILKIFT